MDMVNYADLVTQTVDCVVHVLSVVGEVLVFCPYLLY